MCSLGTSTLGTWVKQKRISCSKEFLRRLRSGQEEFLNRIITTADTWLHYYDPEGKPESGVWKTPGTPPPKKAKVSRSAGKNMFIMFMYRNGMLLTHAVPTGQTVNAAYYSKVVRRDLMHAIRKKGPSSQKIRRISFFNRTTLQATQQNKHSENSTCLDLTGLVTRRTDRT